MLHNFSTIADAQVFRSLCVRTLSSERFQLQVKPKDSQIIDVHESLSKRNYLSTAKKIQIRVNHQTLSAPPGISKAGHRLL
ncbi:unnamed protein product, partial [Porites evermanni]